MADVDHVAGLDLQGGGLDEAVALDGEGGGEDLSGLQVLAEDRGVRRVGDRVDSARHGDGLHQVVFDLRRVLERPGALDQPNHREAVRLVALDLDALPALEGHVVEGHVESPDRQGLDRGGAVAAGAVDDDPARPEDELAGLDDAARRGEGGGEGHLVTAELVDPGGADGAVDGDRDRVGLLHRHDDGGALAQELGEDAVGDGGLDLLDREARDLHGAGEGHLDGARARHPGVVLDAGLRESLGHRGRHGGGDADLQKVPGDDRVDPRRLDGFQEALLVELGRDRARRLEARELLRVQVVVRGRAAGAQGGSPQGEGQRGGAEGRGGGQGPHECTLSSGGRGPQEPLRPYRLETSLNSIDPLPAAPGGASPGSSRGGS